LIKIAGLITGITGIAMLAPMMCAFYYGETKTAIAFVITCPISVVVGFLIFFFMKPSKHALKTRDGYLVVIFCWIACSFFGAIPYMLSGQVPSIIDAIFESVSGYTTTGASTLPDSCLSNSLLLWKATTHWLGGMGILIFIISILPSLGIGSQRLAAAEAPGAGLLSAAPSARDLSRSLYFIYISFTIVEFVLLWQGSSMGALEALINTLGCISTSGLFLHSGGVLFYHSVFVEIVISVFTLLASCNFLIYIYIIQRNFNMVKNNLEIRVFGMIVAGATLIIAVSLYATGTFKTFGESLLRSFFQVSAFASSSGYSIGDYSVWPTFCQGILFILFFVGGCTASTSGSIKVLRVIVMFKLINRGFYKRLHPRAARAVKLNGKAMPARAVAAISTFIFMYFATFLIFSLVLSLQGLDLETTLSATASLMSTTGIGFGDIGAAGNYSVFCPALRLFMSLIMLVGRLELFTIFLLFFPSFWNPNRAKIK